jgi:hypothetical protein
MDPASARSRACEVRSIKRSRLGVFLQISPAHATDDGSLVRHVICRLHWRRSGSTPETASIGEVDLPRSAFGNRWFIEGDNRFQRTAQDIYGFGTNTPSSAALGTDYGFVRIHETAYRSVAKDVYLGTGFLFDSHANVRPSNASDPAWTSSPYIVYSEQNGLPTSATGSSSNSRGPRQVTARR